MKTNYPHIHSSNDKCYLSVDAAFCNNSKKDGIFVTKIDDFDQTHHVLLSSIDEVLKFNNCEYELGYHRFLGSYFPDGNIYLCKHETEPVHTNYYCAGPISLKKEFCVHPEEKRIFIKYTLMENNLSCKLKLFPFLSFRSVDDIRRYSKSTTCITDFAENGIKLKLAQHYPFIFLQSTENTEFFNQPDWYFNFYYSHDSVNNLKVLEDLFVPGFIEISLEYGKPVIVTCGMNEIKASTIENEFDNSKNHKNVSERKNNRKKSFSLIEF